MARPKKTPGVIGKITIDHTATRWRARTSIRDLNGDLVRLAVTASSEQLAVQKLEARAHAVWGGVLRPVFGDTTVRELAESWLEDVRQSESVGTTRRQSTVEAHENTVRTLILPRIGAVPLSAVTVAFCNRFLALLASESPSKAKKARTVLNQMLMLAVEHGALLTNPMREARPLSRATPRYFELSSTQLAGLLRLIRAWQGASPGRKGGLRPDVELLEDMILSALGTSLRPSEVLGLRVEDVNLDASPAEIAVTGTLVRTRRDGLHRQDTTKHARQVRIIPIPEFTRAILSRRMGLTTGAPGELIFTNREGNPYELANLRRLLRAFRDTHTTELNALGIEPEGLTLKAFRQAAATAVRNDGGIELAAALLGHADFRTTAAHYAAPVARVPKDVANAISEAYTSAIEQSPSQ